MLPLALLLASTIARGAEAAATPFDLTPDEVVIFGLLNAHRIDRANGDNRLAASARRKEVNAAIPWLKLRGASSPALPPLVLSPALTLAARALLAKGARPSERKAFDFAPAYRAAGYTPDKTGLVMIGIDQPSLWLAYASAFTQPIGEMKASNGTALVYAGPDSLVATWREIGIAVGGTKGHYTAVIAFGAGAARRYIGGVAYLDANHNGRCDPGEGKAGVTMSVEDGSMTTGPSGTWWRALNTEDAVTVSFAGDGFTAVRPVAKGVANAGIDWRVPNPADIKAADRLIAETEKAAKGDAEAARRSQVALLAGTRMLVLDDPRQRKIDELVATVRDDFESTLRRGLAALAEDPVGFKKKLAEVQKPWKGAIPAWFKELDRLYRTRQQVNSAVAADPKERVKLSAPLLKSLPREIAECSDPAFLEQLEILRESLAEIVPTEPGEAKK